MRNLILAALAAVIMTGCGGKRPPAPEAGQATQRRHTLILQLVEAREDKHAAIAADLVKEGMAAVPPLTEAIGLVQKKKSEIEDWELDQKRWLQTARLHGFRGNTQTVHPDGPVIKRGLDRLQTTLEAILNACPDEKIPQLIELMIDSKSPACEGAKKALVGRLDTLRQRRDQIVPLLKADLDRTLPLLLRLFPEPREQVALLTGLLEKDPAGTSDSVVEALRTHGAKAKAAVPALVKRLQAWKQDAAWTLGNIGPEAAEAVPALLAQVGAPKANAEMTWQRRASAEALRQIVGWESDLEPKMVGLFKQTVEEVQEAVRQRTRTTPEIEKLLYLVNAIYPLERLERFPEKRKGDPDLERAYQATKKLRHDYGLR